MTSRVALQQTIAEMVLEGKGILAADESTPTIEKRFKAIHVSSTEENRRAYRNLLLATPDVGDSLSGVIFFEETLTQRDSEGTPLPELAMRQGFIPGIKVDRGLTALARGVVTVSVSRRVWTGCPSDSKPINTKAPALRSGVVYIPSSMHTSVSKPF